MCLIGEFRRLHNDDKPLFLSLAWSEERENGLEYRQFVLKDDEKLENKLDAKQFVLKSTHSADVDVC